VLLWDDWLEATTRINKASGATVVSFRSIGGSSAVQGEPRSHARLQLRRKHLPTGHGRNA
jgi:hypothetical protein